jgi:hypothetical protein
MTVDNRAAHVRGFSPPTRRAHSSDTRSHLILPAKQWRFRVTQMLANYIRLFASCGCGAVSARSSGFGPFVLQWLKTRGAMPTDMAGHQRIRLTDRRARAIEGR